jgi:predicted RNA-binding protein YlxR (DUF448 family)
MEAAASGQSTGSDTPRGKGRVRTCVGCGERIDTDHEPLIRLIVGPDRGIAVDPGNGGFGRGAHLHARPECLSRAVQRGLSRAAKGPVHLAGEPLTAASLAQAIRQAMDRRIQGLVSAAVRSKAVAIGADAVSGVCSRGEAALVLVACDAAAGAELPEVQAAIAGGRAAAWGTREALGALAGGRREQGVAVLAITSARIAAALGAAVRAADACAATQRPAQQRRAGKKTNVERGA